MKQAFTALMLALTFAGIAHATQLPMTQNTPVVCVTDGCTDGQSATPRR